MCSWADDEREQQRLDANKRADENLAKRYGGSVVVFEDDVICCPICSSPFCDHNISDANFSECRDCGETFTTHGLTTKRVIVIGKE